MIVSESNQVEITCMPVTQGFVIQTSCYLYAGSVYEHIFILKKYFA